MQKKFGSILEENLLNLAKEKAHQKHTTLNHILEEALSEYLSKHKKERQKLSNVEATFGIMRLPLKTVKKIIQEEIYDA